MRSLGAKDQVDDIATKGDVGIVPVDPNEPAGTPEGHLWYDADSTGPSGAASVATKINAGSGLTGGGDLSADRTIAVDFTDPRNYAPPIGVIYAWPFSGTPDANHLLIDGATYNVVDYPTLAGLFGKTSGTFTLPDYRGRVLVNLDALQTEFNLIGKTGGEKTHLLTSAEIPAHTHPIRGATGGASSGTGDRFVRGTTGDDASFRTGNGINVNDQTYGSAATGGQAHNNLQPYAVTNYIIRAK